MARHDRRDHVAYVLREAHVNVVVNAHPGSRLAAFLSANVPLAHPERLDSWMELRMGAVAREALPAAMLFRESHLVYELRADYWALASF